MGSTAAGVGKRTKNGWEVGHSDRQAQANAAKRKLLVKAGLAAKPVAPYTPIFRNKPKTAMDAAWLQMMNGTTASTIMNSMINIMPTATNSTTSGNGTVWWYQNGGTATGRTSSQTPSVYRNNLTKAIDKSWYTEDFVPKEPSFTTLYRDHEYRLPNGSIIEIDKDGNYKFLKENKEVEYRSNWKREFNRYLNASDLIEEFIEYAGSMGVTADEFRDMPMEVFLAWLVVRAAEQDKEEAPVDQQQVITARIHEAEKKCRHCGDRLSAEMVDIGSTFCSPEHMSAALAARRKPAEPVMLTDQRFSTPTMDVREWDTTSPARPDIDAAVYSAAR